MNTNEILTIRKVCETGSISKAASQLFMTPQAISVVIKRVENELGVSLFKRVSGGMIMNDYGKAFFRKSDDLVRDITELEQMFHLDPDNSHGVLRVAFSQGIIVMLGISYILSFTKDHPNFRLEIIEGPDKKIEDLVKTGAVDIGVTVAPFFSDEFQSMQWCKFQCCAMMNPASDFGKSLCGQQSINLASLKDTPIVLENKDFSIYREFVRICMEDYDFVPEIYFETVEIENALAIASRGSAAAIVPFPVAQNSQYEDPDVHIAVIEDDLYWDWQFIKRKKDETSQIEQEFIDHLTARTKEYGWI